MGCIDLVRRRLGISNDEVPEHTDTAKCYQTEQEARAYVEKTCKCGGVVFAKKGRFKNGKPVPGSDGSISPDSISLQHRWDYLLSEGGKYYDINHCALKDPVMEGQEGYVHDSPPQYTEYPDTIWCGACKKQ